MYFDSFSFHLGNDTFVKRASESTPEADDVYSEIRDSMMVENLDAEYPRIKSTYGSPLDEKHHHCNNVYNKPID